MGLAHVVHVELVVHVDTVDRQTRGGDDVPSLSTRSDHPGVERSDVEAVQRRIDGLDLIAANVGDDAAQRGRDTRDRAARGPPSRPTSRISAAHMERAAAAERYRREPRGSCPRSTDTSRIAPAILAFATRTMASAAASVARPNGLPTWVSDALRAACRCRGAPESRRIGAFRIDPPEDDVGIGQSRPRCCPHHSRPDPDVIRRSPAQPREARRRRHGRWNRLPLRWW